MCKTVWIGTHGPPAPSTGTAVASHFRAPTLTCVPSHEGCGCGFFSQYSAYDELDTEAEVRALAGAMLDDEQALFDAECASRERLWAAIRAGLAYGPVELYACWLGDEPEPALGRATVAMTDLEGRLVPFELQVEYLIQ